MSRPGIAATLPTTTGRSSVPQTGAAGNPAYWGTVSGQRIVSGFVSIPMYGAWVADVVLASDQPVPGKCSLSIGNLTLAGAAYRQATFAGRTEARLVGGAGGWSQSVAARGYTNPGGVLLSMVLGDAATEVGERVSIASDRTLGNWWTRIADKASRVLRLVAGPLWWIDGTGTTRIGPRSSPAVASEFTVESFEGAPGTLRIATEDHASWIPGATFSGPTVAQQTVGSVRHTFGGDGIARLEVMAT